MSASSDYLEDKLLDHVLRNTAYTSPTTVYVALFNSDDSTGATSELLEAGTLTTECTGGAYTRQTATFDAISNGSTSNSGNLTWTTASDGNWGTITHVAVMDASSAGNVLFYGALDTAREILQDDTFQITAGSLTITLA
jgi:hypothetical protein